MFVVILPQELDFSWVQTGNCRFRMKIRACLKRIFPKPQNPFLLSLKQCDGASKANLNEPTASPLVLCVWGQAQRAEGWGGDKGQLTQGPAVEAAHEGEHGVVRAAWGLQAEYTVGSERGWHPPQCPLSSSSIRHHRLSQPPLQQVHWSPPKPPQLPNPGTDTAGSVVVYSVAWHHCTAELRQGWACSTVTPFYTDQEHRVMGWHCGGPCAASPCIPDDSLIFIGSSLYFTIS